MILDLVVGGLGQHLLLHQLVLALQARSWTIFLAYASPTPGIVFRSASLAVFRSSGSCAILSSLAAGLVSALAGAGVVLGVWAQTVGAASMPVENRTATNNAINRFMESPPRA